MLYIPQKSQIMKYFQRKGLSQMNDICVDKDRESEKLFLIVLVHETKLIKLAAGQDLTS